MACAYWAAKAAASSTRLLRKVIMRVSPVVDRDFWGSLVARDRAVLGEAGQAGGERRGGRPQGSLGSAWTPPQCRNTRMAYRYRYACRHVRPGTAVTSRRSSARGPAGRASWPRHPALRQNTGCDPSIPGGERSAQAGPHDMEAPAARPGQSGCAPAPRPITKPHGADGRADIARPSRAGAAASGLPAQPCPALRPAPSGSPAGRGSTGRRLLRHRE